jgi:protein-disulfide isomerase
MAECDFCGKEFDSEEELSRHKEEEHKEEQDSDQDGEVDESNQQNEETDKRKRKKDLAFKGLVTFLAISLAVLVIPHMLEISEGGEDTVENVSFNLSEQPMKGSQDAEVTIVEFGDYYCPACKAWKETVMPKIQEKYIKTGEVNFYYLDFPLNIHEPYATEASVAAQCVYSQDRKEFWSYHEALYSAQREIQYDNGRLTQLAEDETEGLNYTELSSCIQEEETLPYIQEDLEKGNSINVSGTPTIYVNGNEAAGIGYRDLKPLIERELE